MEWIGYNFSAPAGQEDRSDDIWSEKPTGYDRS